MERALQAILISGYKMKEKVLYNQKRIIVRKGHRDYTEGPVLIGCPLLNWIVKRNIISVRHTILDEVTEKEYKDDGFGEQVLFKRGLQKHYPKIDWDSPVTVVRWE